MAMSAQFQNSSGYEPPPQLERVGLHHVHPASGMGQFVLVW
jgi:hypothetical protein